MNASFLGWDPPSATEPAVVGMSLVAMLSLRRTGIPRSGFPRSSSPRSPTSPPSRRASLIAWSLTCMKLFNGCCPTAPSSGCPKLDWS